MFTDYSTDSGGEGWLIQCVVTEGWASTPGSLASHLTRCIPVPEDRPSDTCSSQVLGLCFLRSFVFFNIMHILDFAVTLAAPRQYPFSTTLSKLFSMILALTATSHTTPLMSSSFLITSLVICISECHHSSPRFQDRNWVYLPFWVFTSCLLRPPVHNKKKLK